MNEWYSTIYKAFIMTSMISFSIYFLTTDSMSYNSLMAGYWTLILGIAMIILVLFNNGLSLQDTSGINQTLPMLLTSLPFMLMLIIIAVIMFLMTKYSSNITGNKVSDGYNIFSNMLVILLLIQVIMVYTEIGSDKF